MAIFLLIILLLPSLVSAHHLSWNFTSTPTQCQDLSIKLYAEETRPPYELLIIPLGDEIRPLLINHYFRDEETSFQMTYPAGRSFVAVGVEMSDAAGGFGSGGVSGRLTVEAHPENDDSCTRASKGFEKPVFFFIASPDNLTQCRTTVLSWNESIAQGSMKFGGVIPGSQAFPIPYNGTITNTSGSFVSWSTPVAVGTQFILVGGDDRGDGSAGSREWNITGSATDTNNPCVAYNSTNGDARRVGMVFATPKSTCRSARIGPIIAGIIGAAVAIILALIALFYFIRRAHRCPKLTSPLLGEDHGLESLPRPSSISSPPFSPPTPYRDSESSLSAAVRVLRRTEPDFDPYLTWTVDSMPTGQTSSKASANEPASVSRLPEAGPSLAPVNADLPPAYM